MENSKRAIALMACLVSGAIISPTAPTGTPTAPTTTPKTETTGVESAIKSKWTTPAACVALLGASWLFSHWAVQLLGLALAAPSIYYTFNATAEDVSKDSFITEQGFTAESFNSYYKIALAVFAIVATTSLLTSLMFTQYRTLGMLSKVMLSAMTFLMIAIKPDASEKSLVGAGIVGAMFVPMALLGLPAILAV